MSLTHRLRNRLMRDGAAGAKQVIETIYERAIAGDTKLLALLFDRIDGPVAVRVIVDGELQRMLQVAERTIPHEHYVDLLEALTRESGALATGSDSDDDD